MRRISTTIIYWEWLILLLLLPLLLFPSGWRALALAVIPILWLLRKIAFGYLFPHTAYDVTLFLLVVALFISLAAVFDMTLSFVKIAGLIFGIEVFYAGIQFTRTRREGVYHLLGLFCLLGTAMVKISLLGTLQSPVFTLLSPLTSRIPGSISAILGILPTVNPNEMAGILSWIVPLLLACTIGFWGPLWRSGRWWPKLLSLVLVLLLVFNASLLFATQSRGGILAFMVALLVMLAVRFRWGRWLLLIVFIAAVILAFSMDLGALLQGNTESSVDLGLQGRLEIWSRAFYGLADFPITGMSMNGFRYVVHVLYPLFTFPPDLDIAHAHNHLLQAGLDLGIPGLIAYLGIWIVSVILLWIGWRMAQGQTDRVLIIGLSGSLVAGWMFGMLDAIALGARPGFLWWMLLALVVTVFDRVMITEEVQ